MQNSQATQNLIDEVVCGTAAKVIGDVAEAESYAADFKNNYQVEFVNQDQYMTIAVVTDADGRFVATGASKRHANDKQNSTRGKALALSRAVKYMFNLDAVGKTF